MAGLSCLCEWMLAKFKPFISSLSSECQLSLGHVFHSQQTMDASVNGCRLSLSHAFLHSQQTIAVHVNGCWLSLGHVFLDSQQTMDASLNGCRLSLSHVFLHSQSINQFRLLVSNKKI